MHRLQRMGGVGRVFAVVAAVLCVAVGIAGVAAADDTVRLNSRLGDFCLDAPGADYFTAVVINPCEDSDSQRWYRNGRQLQNVAFPGGCLINPAVNVNPSGEGMFAHLGPCVAMAPQNWNVDPNGQVKNDTGWYCLTVLGGPGPGTWVSARYCNGDPNQGWDVIS
ncbi:RICIN domain-containing protein [Mycobacterium sp. SMC-19]|uniref:Rv1419 family lectin n=1 Tax=Mycobacterium sp. SMC-19 TaxID=3381630 RepID=UPI0038763F33